ncbi:hypothetical protein A3C59_04405 [Candidatus Daviesbacteria bacterium RIFCSPHIGHO2_02_FULL_36_13]|uniref:HD/PDEase domain-containing protein n=1 Tax=Candidatus Daviesbacteria bacterium RIFCSPHIGHO2_02_FULL_36_13 TaxID=1797768 RepID=A0A1F5JVY1_9BACT|nr:MAG: hypothetical protein A3C59_04405 [Candidatus Daviesbacteria bacterium RIFCSPHIGHO2_02_FULL_36_13]
MERTISDHYLEMSSTNPEFMLIKDPDILKGILLHRVAAQDSLGLVTRAIETAESAHTGQKRKEGTPYILHPLRVSLRLLEEGSQPLEAVAVAVMHDTLEDCPTLTTDDLNTNFGNEISQGVAALSKTIASTGNKKDTDEYFNVLKSPSSPNYIRRIKVYDRIDNLYSILLLTTSPNNVGTKEFSDRYLVETEKYFIELASIDSSLQDKLDAALESVRAA